MTSKSEYPTIKDISLRNYQLVEDSLFQKHVKGDIYYKDKCIGYYDPAQMAGGVGVPQVFIRIENDSPVEVYSLYKDYLSILDYPTFAGQEVDGVRVIPKGFGVLLSDLEYLVRLFDFMEQMLGPDDKDYEDIPAIGVINNNTIAPIRLKVHRDMSVSEWIKCLGDIPQIKLDNKYPIHIFKSRKDFIF